MNQLLLLAFFFMPLVVAEDPTIFDKTIRLSAVTTHYVEPTPAPALPPAGSENTEVKGIPAPSEASLPAEVIPDSYEVINKVTEIREAMESLEDMLEPTIQKLASIPKHRLLSKMLT
jgi:hypothetical protein